MRVLLAFLGILVAGIGTQGTETLDIETSYRFATTPHKFQCFSFPEKSIKPRTNYDIKVSFLGTKGADFRIIWKNPEKQDSLIRTFKFLDTEKLSFRTNEKGEIEDEEIKYQGFSIKNGEKLYHFCLVGFLTAFPRSRDLLTEPLEYYLKIESVIFPGFPPYVLQEIILVLLITIIAVFLSFRYFLPGFLRYISRFFPENLLKTK